MGNYRKYLVVYDVSDDRERHRVSKTLEGYGFRIQKSAFECSLTRSGKERIIERLKALEIETGFVNIYQVHANARVISIGLVPEHDPDGDHAYVV
ncbi:MAG: CRISPR-associated endonuclease Cas2 [Deltaproteobacteria bacterium]|nr:MAG: CRISPR-associated endonuclease Cas2 [Deltaproteobacteria bacterium]